MGYPKMWPEILHLIRFVRVLMTFDQMTQRDLYGIDGVKSNLFRLSEKQNKICLKARDNSRGLF